jgi:hypothetical protein
MKWTIALLLVLLASSAGLAGCTSTASSANPYAGRLTIQVKLDSLKVDAGTPISGIATIRNETNKSIPWHQCPQDWPSFGLVGHGAKYNPGDSGVLCVSRMVLKAHSSMRYSVTVETTYDGCGGLGQPVCPHDGIPLLPLGRYAVDVDTVNSGLLSSITVLPTPRVTLVNATTRRSVGPVGGSMMIQAYGCETVSYPQPPIAVVLTSGKRVIAMRSKLGVTQEMIVGVSPGAYVIRSSGRPLHPVRVVDGVQAVAVVISDC